MATDIAGLGTGVWLCRRKAVILYKLISNRRQGFVEYPLETFRWEMVGWRWKGLVNVWCYSWKYLISGHLMIIELYSTQFIFGFIHFSQFLIYYIIFLSFEGSVSCCYSLFVRSGEGRIKHSWARVWGGGWLGPAAGGGAGGGGECGEGGGAAAGARGRRPLLYFAAK